MPINQAERRLTHHIEINRVLTNEVNRLRAELSKREEQFQ